MPPFGKFFNWYKHLFFRKEIIFHDFFVSGVIPCIIYHLLNSPDLPTLQSPTTHRRTLGALCFLVMFSVFSSFYTYWTFLRFYDRCFQQISFSHLLICIAFLLMSSRWYRRFIHHQVPRSTWNTSNYCHMMNLLILRSNLSKIVIVVCHLCFHSIYVFLGLW